MEDKKQFVKLSTLVGDEFTVKSVEPYVFKKWNPAESKMEVSQDWQEGFRKIYPVVTDKGQIDMGGGQLGSLLEAVFYGGKSDLVGRTFAVKSNGKMGMDIRYFFNPVKGQPAPVEKKQDTVVPFDESEPVSLDDIPF